MKIEKILPVQYSTSTTPSPWIQLINDLKSQLSGAMDPATAASIWQFIQAVNPIAQNEGGQFASDFQTLYNDFQTFLSNPSSSLLATIEDEISPLIGEIPNNNNFISFMADDPNGPCQKLLGLMSNFNPQNESEIQALMNVLSDLSIDASEGQLLTGLQSDYSFYLQDPTGKNLGNVESDITSIILYLNNQT